MAIVDVPVRKLPFKSSDCFQNITGFTVYIETIFPPIHLLKTVVWDVVCTSHLRTVLLLSAPFVCSSSWFHLSYSTRALQNIWLCNTCNHSFVYKVINRKNRFSRFHQKVAQDISGLRFQLCITFVLDYRFTWNER